MHGDLESGHQGSAQAVSSLLSPDPSSGEGKVGQRADFAVGFHKATCFFGSPAPNCCPRMLRLINFLCSCSLWVVLPLRWQIPNHPEGRTGLSKVPGFPEFYVSCGLFQTFLLLVHLQADSLTLSV